MDGVVVGGDWVTMGEAVGEAAAAAAGRVGVGAACPSRLELSVNSAKTPMPTRTMANSSPASQTADNAWSESSGFAEES
jgi:hypothetical protein